jgi:transcriptional regulator with XRE-family HTH domain
LDGVTSKTPEQISSADPAQERREDWADNCRRLRRRKGWTQRQLGDAAGLSQLPVSRVESARGYVGADALDRIARALGGNLPDLFPTHSQPGALPA